MVVLLEEVDEAISRNTPHSDITRGDMRTIQRIAESILKRNVREQGVLPTASQREITIAHVVTNYDRTKTQTSTTSFTVPPTSAERTTPANRQNSQPTTSQPRQTSQPTASQPRQTRQNSQPTSSQPRQNRQNSSQPTASQPRQSKQRVEIGVWTTIGSSSNTPRHVLAYADQIPRAIACMAIWLVVTFFVGSPISLFWTIPALYWIVKVLLSCLLYALVVSYRCVYIPARVMVAHPRVSSRTCLLD